MITWRLLFRPSKEHTPALAGGARGTQSTDIIQQHKGWERLWPLPTLVLISIAAHLLSEF